ncbi:MAG: F0F1 ATP synthase subunit A [Deltaproteobacteria bacterium]|nr:F0F1 ATP synthase subunit A [Deltaproteobacteria bacterium]
MLISEGFLFFSTLYHGFNHSNIHVVHGLLVLLFLLVIGILYKAAQKSVDAEVLPSEHVSIKNILQVTVEGLLNLIRGIVPHHTEDYLPLLAAVFVYIFVCNIMGIIPGLLPPTENLNTNYAIAITVFVYYHYVGLKRVGFKAYMEHFTGPSIGSTIGLVLFRFLFFAPLMFVIEIISHSIRPFSLSLRLFGNIFGDHQVWSIFADLTSTGYGMLLFFVPIVFLCFGIFVSFVQAFVFTLLSTVYVGLAVEKHEH